MYKFLFLFLMAMVLGTWAGCASDSTEEYSLSIVYQNAQCGNRSVLAKWVNSKTVLERTITKPGALSLTGAGANALLPDMDTSAFNYLYVSAGAKPSAGYLFGLKSPAFSVQDKGTVLPLEVIDPVGNSSQAAVMTQPCAILEIEKGQYGTLRVLDIDVKK